MTDEGDRDGSQESAGVNRRLADAARLAAEQSRRVAGSAEPEDQERLDEDVLSAERQEDAANRAREVAEQLRRNAAAMEQTARDIEGVKQRLREGSEELQELVDDARALGSQTQRIAEDVRDTENTQNTDHS